jgi:hypothetical protein
VSDFGQSCHALDLLTLCADGEFGQSCFSLSRDIPNFPVQFDKKLESIL